MANVEIAGRSPISVTRVARQPDLLLGLAQRRLGQVGVLGVLAPAGEGDLAGVAAQVGAAPREHDVRRLGGAGCEQRHEHRRARLLARAAVAAPPSARGRP